MTAINCRINARSIFVRLLLFVLVFIQFGSILLVITQLAPGCERAIIYVFVLIYENSTVIIRES